MSGFSAYDLICGKRLCNYGVCTYYAVVAYMNSGHNYHAGTYPDVIADNYFLWLPVNGNI